MLSLTRSVVRTAAPSEQRGGADFVQYLAVRLAPDNQTLDRTPARTCASKLAPARPGAGQRPHVGSKNMKAYILALLELAMLVSSLRAADDIDWSNMKPTTVLKAISMFESDPGGTNGTSAMAIVVNFAEANTNVHVVIDSGFLPWLTRKPEVEKGEILLAAFVAGNIRPQLQKQIKQDHPIDAISFMCRTYTLLRKKNLIEKIPELEQWSKMGRNEITELIPKIKYKKSQQPDAEVQSEGAPSD